MKNRKTRLCAGLLCLATLLSLLSACGDKAPNNTQTGEGYHTYDYDYPEKVVEMGTPERTLDPQAVYSKITYVPEMFYGMYRIIGGKKAEEQFLNDMDLMTFPEIKTYGSPSDAREVTALPYEIQAGKSNLWGSGRNDKYYWMDVTYKTKEGGVFTRRVTYSVEGNVLRLVFQESTKNEETDERIYTPTDFVVEYQFSFKGNELTLYKDGKSVTLHEGYIYGDEKAPHIYSDGELTPGSAMLDNIVSFDYLYAREEKHTANRFTIKYLDAEGKKQTVNYCNAFFSKDGLLTFTVNYPEGPKTYQYVYFLCDDDGVILTDGDHTFFYNVGRYGVRDYQLEDTVDGDVTDLTDDQKEDLVVTQRNILTELEEALRGANINAKVDPEMGKVTLDNSILFGVDSSALSADGQAYLNHFLEVYASVILPYAEEGVVSQVVVEGHTDTSGSYDYNLKLSQARADTVAAYCLEQQPGLTVSAMGYSYDNPVYDETGAVDMDASRRVVFRFLMTVPD